MMEVNLQVIYIPEIILLYTHLTKSSIALTLEGLDFQLAPTIGFLAVVAVILLFERGLQIMNIDVNLFNSPTSYVFERPKFRFADSDTDERSTMTLIIRVLVDLNNRVLISEIRLISRIPPKL